MEAALIAEAKKCGATIITYDADKDIPTQLQQLDNMIAQKVDGIVIFIADQRISNAVVEKCKNAGIPIIGESIRLIDSSYPPIISGRKVTVSPSFTIVLLPLKNSILTPFTRIVTSSLGFVISLFNKFLRNESPYLSDRAFIRSNT